MARASSACLPSDVYSLTKPNCITLRMFLAAKGVFDPAYKGFLSNRIVLLIGEG